MDIETTSQQLAQVNRKLRLVNFKLIQLRHTHDQLLAWLQDLLAEACLVAEAGQLRTAMRLGNR